MLCLVCRSAFGPGVVLLARGHSEGFRRRTPCAAQLVDEEQIYVNTDREADHARALYYPSIGGGARAAEACYASFREGAHGSVDTCSAR